MQHLHQSLMQPLLGGGALVLAGLRHLAQLGQQPRGLATPVWRKPLQRRIAGGRQSAPAGPPRSRRRAEPDSPSWQRTDTTVLPAPRAVHRACSPSRVLPTPASPSITTSRPPLPLRSRSLASSATSSSRPISGTAAGVAAVAAGSRAAEGAGDALVDRVVERARLGQRSHAQLAIEHPYALPILVQRFGAVSGGGVERDQRPVCRLVQLIQRQSPRGVGDGLACAAGRAELGNQPVERGFELRPQPPGMPRVASRPR